MLRESHSTDAKSRAFATPQITDVLDGETIRVFQEAVSAVTHVPTVVCDRSGRPVIGASDPLGLLSHLQASPRGRTRLLEIYAGLAAGGSAGQDRVLNFEHALIRWRNQDLGAIIAGGLPEAPLDQELRRILIRDFDVPAANREPLTSAMTTWDPRARADARTMMALLADIIARLAEQAHLLLHRELELGSVHQLGQMLSGTQDLQVILDTISRQACEVLGVDATSIRLLDEHTNELIIKSVHNLSATYLNKGPVILKDSPIDRAAFAGDMVYVEDLRRDPRTLFPEEARREGIVSGLSVGLTYRGQTIGVMRVYTHQPHDFSTPEKALLRSFAGYAAAAITNSRLYIEALQAQAYQRQLHYAGEIQRRMIPDRPPPHAYIEFAYAYEPTHEVGGDFFDFYLLPAGEGLGVCVADVAGKGMPAALLMASLRTAMRLYAYSVTEITEVLPMINVHMNRETLVSEFATLFYGVFSANGRRLTYGNAGHDPPLHCRDGRITELKTGDFVIGVNDVESYHKKTVGLRADDVVLFYTDGIVDARNFSEEAFGRQRLADSLIRHAHGTADQIARNMIWDVRRFVGLADQVDDITMLVARITPRGKKAASRS